MKLVKCENERKLLKCSDQNKLVLTNCLPRRDDACMIGGADILPRVIQRYAGYGVQLYYNRFENAPANSRNVSWSYSPIHNTRIPDTNYPYFREMYLDCESGERTWEIVSDIGEYQHYIQMESQRWRSDGESRAIVKFFNGYNPLLDTGDPNSMGRLTTFAITEQIIYRLEITSGPQPSHRWVSRPSLGICVPTSCDFDLHSFNSGYSLTHHCPPQTFWCEQRSAEITIMDVYNYNQFIHNNYARHHFWQMDCSVCPVCNALTELPYTGVTTDGIIRVGRAVTVWDFNGLVNRRIEFSDLVNTTVYVRTSGFLSSSGISVNEIYNGFGSWSMNFNNIFRCDQIVINGDRMLATKSFNGGFDQVINSEYDPMSPCTTVAQLPPFYQEHAPYRMGATIYYLE